jgi:formyl-CoA transferase
LAAGHPEWEHDPRFATNRERVANREALAPLIETAFAGRTSGEWLARLTAEGVPAAPIQTMDRALADPQLRLRQMVVEMQHPRHGAIPTLGTPIKVDGRMGLEVAPPPALGEHTDAVLGELLKYPGERIADLRRTGAIK